jgi:hypothetical protein
MVPRDKTAGADTGGVMIYAVAIVVSISGVLGAFSGAATAWTDEMWPVYATLACGVTAGVMSAIGVVAYINIA